MQNKNLILVGGGIARANNKIEFDNLENTIMFADRVVNIPSSVRL